MHEDVLNVGVSGLDFKDNSNICPKKVYYIRRYKNRLDLRMGLGREKYSITEEVKS